MYISVHQNVNLGRAILLQLNKHTLPYAYYEGKLLFIMLLNKGKGKPSITSWVFCIKLSFLPSHHFQTAPGVLVFWPVLLGCCRSCLSWRLPHCPREIYMSPNVVLQMLYVKLQQQRFKTDQILFAFTSICVAMFTFCDDVWLWCAYLAYCISCCQMAENFAKFYQPLQSTQMYMYMYVSMHWFTDFQEK